MPYTARAVSGSRRGRAGVCLDLRGRGGARRRRRRSAALGRSARRSSRSGCGLLRSGRGAREGGVVEDGVVVDELV